MQRRTLGLSLLRTAALVVFIGGAAARLAAGQVVPPEVRHAAQAGLHAFLGPGTGGGAALRRLGFRDASDATQSIVGPGLQIYTVPPDRIADAADGDLSALAVPTTLWQFVVMNGTSARAVLTVDRMNGQWTAVSLGAAGLAEQLARLLRRWPPESHRLRLIRIYQASADLVEVVQGGRQLGLVPMHSARVSLRAAGPFDPDDLWPAVTATARLRPSVRAALGRRQGGR